MNLVLKNIFHLFFNPKIMEEQKSFSGPGDPPKSVGKIVIKKGAGTEGEGLSVTLDFTSNGSVTFPGVTLFNFYDWELTKKGKDAGYPAQDNFEIPMISGATGTQNEYRFEGTVTFDFGNGTGYGVMYRTKILVSGFDPTEFIDVRIEE